MRVAVSQFANRQFALFVVTGGSAACVNYLSRFAYNEFVTFSTAVLLAYCTGMVTAYVLARLFVFRSTRNSLQSSAAWFVIINFIAVLQTWVISVGLAYYGLPALGITRFAKEIAHLAGVATPVFTSFLGHKYLSFRE